MTEWQTENELRPEVVVALEEMGAHPSHVWWDRGWDGVECTVCGICTDCDPPEVSSKECVPALPSGHDDSVQRDVGRRELVPDE